MLRKKLITNKEIRAIEKMQLIIIKRVAQRALERHARVRMREKILPRSGLMCIFMRYFSVPYLAADDHSKTDYKEEWMSSLPERFGMNYWPFKEIYKWC